MYFCLFIALLSTFIWIDTNIAESINAKIYPYANADRDEEDKKRAKFKTCLVIIMALFWAAVIRFSL